MYAVIRVRGDVNLNPQIRKTLEMLRLHNVNHCSLVDNENKSWKNMVEKVKDYVTYGEVDEENLAKMLGKRGRLTGNKRLGEDFLKAQKVKDVTELAGKILSGRKLEDFGIKPVFRLTPPKKGHARKGIKKNYNIGGALGYRGKEINKLLEKMI